MKALIASSLILWVFLFVMSAFVPIMEIYCKIYPQIVISLLFTRSNYQKFEFVQLYIMTAAISFSLVNLVLSPLIDGEVIRTDYFIIINNLLFLFGIGLFVSTTIVVSIISLFLHQSLSNKITSLNYIILIAIIYISYFKITNTIQYPLDMPSFYNMLLMGYYEIFFFFALSALISLIYPTQYIIISLNLLISLICASAMLIYKIDSPELESFYYYLFNLKIMMLCITIGMLVFKFYINPIKSIDNS
jgi:hypothetical protein